MLGFAVLPRVLGYLLHKLGNQLPIPMHDPFVCASELWIIYGWQRDRFCCFEQAVEVLDSFFQREVHESITHQCLQNQPNRGDL